MSNDSFKVKKSLTLTPQDLTLLVSPEAGDIACDINDSNKIKRYDSVAAAWKEVGSGGGVGGVDILFAQSFEEVSLASFTQTGLVLDGTSPLHGVVSALLVHQAGVPQSFKQVIPVDPKFRGLNQVLELNVKSNATAGNVTIEVYDETNAASILSSTQLNLSTDVSGRKDSVAFTIPLTCESLSYTITALQEAGSPETRIDDIVCQINTAALLETSVTVPIITEWQSYTPTFQGFGTPSAIEMQWRQNGQNAEIRGKFTAGTSTAVEARVGLPAGLSSAGAGVIPSLQVVGTCSRNSAVSAGNGGNRVTLIEPSVSYVTFAFENPSSSGLTKITGSGFASSIAISFFASVPCAGLSATVDKVIPLTQSGLIQEADSVLYAAGNGGQVIATAGDIPFTPLSNNGSNISFNGTTVTVLKSGIYSVSVSTNFTTSLQRSLLLTTSGSDTYRISDIGAIASGIAGAITLDLNEGESFAISTIINGGTLSNSSVTHFLKVTHQGSLKQVAVSSDQKIKIPTSELRFEGASSRGAVATAVVKFDTLAKIRGDAFSVTNTANDGTYVTMLKAGKLDVSSSSAYSGSQNNQTQITLNQTTLTAVSAISSEILSQSGVNSASNPRINIGWSGFVKIGDTVRIAANFNPFGGNETSLNLTFQEQDISVSVSNTLPQFSESDSSVRVDTANGYGSTGTKIRRFSNVRDNLGVDVEYVDSATNGASFTAKSDGIYSVSYSENFSAGSSFGLSKNVSSLTTNFTSLVASERLSLSSSSAASFIETTAWEGYLQEGDVVRPHTNGSAASVNDQVQFTMSKVGKPNVTGVDVTPFVNVPQPESQSVEFQTITGAFGSTDTGIPILTASKEVGSGIISVVSNTTNGTSFVALKNCVLDISATAAANPAATLYLTRNAVVNTATNPNVATIIAMTGIAAALSSNVSTSVSLSVGDVVRVHRNSTNITSVRAVTLTATALSDQILTVPETFSTDTAALSYAGSGEYTLSTLANAPVGKYITFSYAANTNIRTQGNTRPAQTDSHMNANGIQLFARAYNAGSLLTQPAAIAIQIGKGLKGKSLDLYKSAGKVTAGSLDISGASGIATLIGMTIKDYNESTGILIADAGYTIYSGVTSHAFHFSDNTTGTNGYLVINASKNSSLVGIGLPLVYSESAGNAGQVITANVTNISFIGISDTNGAWNGSQYVVPETGVYAFGGTSYFTTAVTRNLYLYIDGIQSTLLEVSSFSVASFVTTRRFTKGQVISLRTTVTSTLNTSGTLLHHLEITKVSN